MLKNLKENMQKYGTGTALTVTALAPFSAFAQVDTSDATGSLAEVGTAVAAIGVAMIAAISAGIAYRWIVAFLAK